MDELSALRVFHFFSPPKFPYSLPYFIAKLDGAKKNAPRSLRRGAFEKGSITHSGKKKPRAYSSGVESGPFGAWGDRYILIFSSPTAAAAALGRMIRVISHSCAFCPAAGINKTTVTLETNKIASRCLSTFSLVSLSHVVFFSRAGNISPEHRGERKPPPPLFLPCWRLDLERERGNADAGVCLCVFRRQRRNLVRALGALWIACGARVI
jgi:hypothetical protein